MLGDSCHTLALSRSNKSEFKAAAITDNWMFKLYYRASALLCMTGATVGIATQYFGDPIRWDRDINNNNNIIILFFYYKYF